MIDLTMCVRLRLSSMLALQATVQSENGHTRKVTRARKTKTVVEEEEEEELTIATAGAMGRQERCESVWWPLLQTPWPNPW